MNYLTQLNTDAECKVDDIATNLYKRIQEETEKILRSQFGKLGIEFPEYDCESIDGLKKAVYPIKDKRLTTYYYNDIPILEISIGDNQMGIEFITPEIKGDSECIKVK